MLYSVKIIRNLAKFQQTGIKMDTYTILFQGDMLKRVCYNYFIVKSLQQYKGLTDPGLGATHARKKKMSVKNH